MNAHLPLSGGALSAAEARLNPSADDGSEEYFVQYEELTSSGSRRPHFVRVCEGRIVDWKLGVVADQSILHPAGAFEGLLDGTFDPTSAIWRTKGNKAVPPFDLIGCRTDLRSTGICTEIVVAWINVSTRRIDAAVSSVWRSVLQDGWLRHESVDDADIPAHGAILTYPLAAHLRLREGALGASDLFDWGGEIEGDLDLLLLICGLIDLQHTFADWWQLSATSLFPLRSHLRLWDCPL